MRTVITASLGNLTRATSPNFLLNNRFYKIIIIALTATILGSSSEYLLGLETSFGLDNLFKLRGSRSPPESIVIITMDEKSEIDLGLGQDLTDWRQYHAKLIDELAKQGVAQIVFDLQFIKSNNQYDPELANAMRRANNVLVTECTQKFLRGNEGFFGREECSEVNKAPSTHLEGTNNIGLSDQLVVMRRIPPNALLTDASVGYAPFHLPKNHNIHEAWLYFDALAEAPGLPLLIWSHFLKDTKPPHFYKHKAKKSYGKWLTQQRRDCLQNPENYVLDSLLTPDQEHQLTKIICGADIRYLDFYGPPKTFRMESYSDVYHGKTSQLENKIILVGKAYRQYYYSNTDTYTTPYSSKRLGKMSGVEILATQLANLIEDRWVEMPIPINIGLLIFSVCVAGVLVSINGWKRWPVIILIVGAYIVITIWCFSTKGIWLPIATPLIIQLPVILFFDLISRYLEKRRQKIAVSRYIDKKIEAYVLGPDAKQLGGQNMFCTVLFSDVRDFTTQTEKQGPEETVGMLNEYFSLMVECIQKENGVMDKFIGDAIMATFGIPVPTNNDADCAIRSSISMIKRLEAWNAIRYSENKQPVKIGIGVNTDNVMFGNIGSEDYMNLTVIGDGVNLAARLETACKQYAAQILISEFTFQNLNDKYQIRELDIVVVKGKTDPVTIYEVLDYHSQESFPNMIAFLAIFQNGLDLYRSCCWQTAVDCFTKALQLNPNDYPCHLYLERCEFFIKNPPEEGWAGVWVMQSK